MTGSGTNRAEEARDGKPPLLIKRYASRRLYNTETSDYVTLEDIARIIREGREVQIVDLKSGEDVTRQYLLQIIAEHEARGENVLPISVLTDLVRAYTSQLQGVMPDFLARSFEMLRQSQEQLMKTMTGGTANPFTAPLTAPLAMMSELQRKQQEFLAGMMGLGSSERGAAEEAPARSGGDAPQGGDPSAEELAEIRRQLAELKDKLSKLE